MRNEYNEYQIRMLFVFAFERQQFLFNTILMIIIKSMDDLLWYDVWGGDQNFNEPGLTGKLRSGLIHSRVDESQSRSSKLEICLCFP